jgi:hypothetical protein
MLPHQKDKAWHDIITLDESWFYFATFYEWVWLPEGTEAPERERINVQSRKVMMTIVWNLIGFEQIVARPKGMKFNANYSISHMLDSLAEWRKAKPGARIEDCTSTLTVLPLTLRTRLMNFSQAMA